tara:strand:- start:543 stop:824 length:282 start_codon:yes stop_codon:yes gene_type:complete
MSTILSETNLGNGLIRYQYEGWYEDKSAPTVAPEPTAEEIAANARAWRDSELTSTDNTPSDHSQYDAIIAYRVSLRQWPSTADFPATKPTLGS